MLMYISKYISSACALLMALLMAAVAQSCIGAPSGDLDDSQYSEAMQGQGYDGTWQIDDYKKSGIVVVHPGYFTALDMPYRMMAAKLFEGKEIKDVTGSMGNDRLEYVAATAQDGTVLYTIKPKTMFITATVDGWQRRATLYLSPAAGSANDMSWGRLSKNGVMSIVLCVAQYSMDGGDIQRNASIKFTFTGLRK